jgi:hypothetical protein
LSAPPKQPRLAVLSELQTPRSMPELIAALPDLRPRQVQATVYNVVTRGHAVNLRAADGRKCGGLFVALQPDAPMQPRFDLLIDAWSGPQGLTA